MNVPKIDLDSWFEESQSNDPDQNADNILIDSAESVQVILDDKVISTLSNKEIFWQIPVHVGIHAVIRMYDHHETLNRILRIEELRLQERIAIAIALESLVAKRGKVDE